MGEIGRDRREFLFSMTYCEILLIVRGYRRRNILSYQLQRLMAYGSFHCMSGDQQHLGPDGWLPLYFDKYKGMDAPPISEKEVQEQLALLDAINAQEDAETTK